MGSSPGYRLSRAGMVLLAALCLAACSGDKDKDKDVEKPVDELYNDAAKQLEDGDYKKSASLFEEVERQYPYSQWATRAQLMAAFAQYEGQDYDASVATLDRFIQLHPGNPQIDYAYYLRALDYYERVADVARDQNYTREAEKALQDIVSRFPDTAYARDAIVKISLIQDQLAGAEMEVGRYYIKQKIYNAALSRFQNVVEKYQTTSHVPEALHRMVECYLGLGIKKEAQATAAVLGYNFPGSPWYQYSYDLLDGEKLTPQPSHESWIGRAWRRVL
ncbi:MAG: outer membrane protein assembly factor BamD [Alphaproteobacteria bacterium]